MNWIKKHKFLSIFFISSLILILSSFLPAFLKFKNYNSPFILKYSNDNGIILIGSIYYLISFFLTSLIVFFINFLLAKNFESRDVFFGKLIAVLNFLICLLIFIYFVTIIKVN